MLRRQYSSIAEEPEEEEEEHSREAQASVATTLELIEEQPTESIINLNTERRSTNSARLSPTGITEDTMDESGSERLSGDEEDDVFSELDESMNKSAGNSAITDWEKRMTVAENRTPSPDSTKGDSELTESQIREIREAFLVFDDNGDGCISATELKKLVTSLGYNITEAELMDMMNQIDSDGNGAIDFPEFLQLMTKNLEDTDPDDITMETFKVFDRDNNGNIGIEELQRVMKLLGQDFKDYEIEAMIQGADFDGDGAVNYEDFTRMMNA